MATKLPATDIVIIGLGWTGSIIAESMTKAGFNVVAIERGPWRDTATDFPPGYAPDELRYAVQHDLFVRPAQTTLTFRNNPSQTALPIRTWGAFLLPNGVGGAGVHWNAQTWRFLPTDFVLKTHLTQRYGAKFLPDDMTIQDWGVTYDELEPHFDAFEYLCGTSGTAGNLKGQKQPFGNPFEGARSRPYPTPAQKQPYGPVKRLELLHELLPSASVFAVLINPANTASTEVVTRNLKDAARSLGLQLHFLRASTAAEIDAAFEGLAVSRADALIVSTDPFFASRKDQIVALAARQAIPATYEWRGFAVAGGLMSYGSGLADSYRQAGIYTGKILKGAKPADLPVQQVVKLELVINLKTAKAFGLTIPQLLLGRADEVIE